jgi:hypothetical protein
MSVARLLPLLLCIALAACGGDDAVPKPSSPTQVTKAAAPVNVVQIPGGPGHLAAMASRRGLTLRDRPNGRVVARLRQRTEYGSPTVVWAATRHGRWLGVVADGLPNNRMGWVDIRDDRPRMWRSPLAIEADLSARMVELRRGSKVVRRIPVTIGGPGSPTPVGRFTVTDKLIPDHGVSYYGCCLIALSGRQPKLRPGWAGGDRIAIHGSPGQLVGAAASGGCLRARNRDLRALMKVVPLGTPVVIRA